MTHDDLQRPVRVKPENTRETPGIFNVCGSYVHSRRRTADRVCDDLFWIRARKIVTD